MPANLGLSHLSDAFLVVALLYSLAVLAFAADFAFGRRSPVVTRARQARAPGARGRRWAPGGRRLGLRTRGPAAGARQRPWTGLAGGDRRAGVGGRQPAGPHRPWPPGRLVRIALVATTAGLAAHVAGVITRGLAVHRIPWGDMYEFVIALTCVAVMFFLGLMIRYKAYYLGLFVMGAVVIALGLAQTVIYTAPGRWCPRCSPTGCPST